MHNLRGKLAATNQTVEALRTQLDHERQAHRAAEQERSMAQVPAAVDEIGDATGNQPVKRRRGRPPGKRNAATPRPAGGKSRADNQAPVQWWSKGWTPKT